MVLPIFRRILHVLKTNHDTLPPLLWFALLWLVSALYLLRQGHLLPLALATAAFLFWGLHTWLSGRVTSTPAVTSASAGVRRWQSWLQIMVILFFAAIANQPLPLWGELVAWLRTLGEQTLPVVWVGGPGNALANPVQYFVLPLLVLLVLGAKPDELGLQWGQGTGRVCAVWLLLPVVTFGILVGMGQIPAQTLARRLLGNALQNGFFEEFLFRGALQSRLVKVLSPAWALVTQALVFGIWHLNANLAMFGGDWPSALAWCIVSQAMIGLLFGLLFQRTRSLIAPSVAHVITNTVGQTVG
ncbi:MAG: CPBP family intramembrane glutamic endopeptidase [Caldilineaceae bacterium]